MRSLCVYTLKTDSGTNSRGYTYVVNSGNNFRQFKVDTKEMVSFQIGE